MFAQVYFPETLSRESLDHYLEQGWFRMGQTIFTTNFLNFKNQLYSALWLRASLREFVPSKAQQKIARLNEKFRVEIQKASITPEKEMLFATYKLKVPFEASASLQQLLYGKNDTNIYNTYEVLLYDGDKLIGVGYFDVGIASAEGISSFYDPAYKKFSLGKYLIFLKMSYCKSLRLRYFYPGYFVPGYRAFDYKLELSNSIEYFQLHTARWIDIQNFSPGKTPLAHMVEKLKSLQDYVAHCGLKTNLLQYEFFDANLIPDLKGMDLFDFPVFLNLELLGVRDPRLVVFDVRDDQYHVLQCVSIWEPNFLQETPGFYNAQLLRVGEELFASHLLLNVLNFIVAAKADSDRVTD